MTLSYSGQFNRPTTFRLNGKPVDNGGNNGDIEKEYATVKVTVEEPTFDQNLFTPSISIDGQSKDVSFGQETEFKVEAGKELQLSASRYTLGDKAYKAVISEDNFILNKDEKKWVTITYQEKDVEPITNHYVGYFQSWSDKWASSSLYFMCNGLECRCIW